MGETRTGNGTGKLVAALLALALTYAGEVAGVVVGMLLDADLDLCATTGGAIVAVVAIIALGGRAWLRWDGRAMLEAWKFMWWIVAISAVLMVWDWYDYVDMGEAVHPGWVLRCVSSLALCLAIGANEEGMFRGLLMGGLLARLGGRKRGVWWAVVIASLAFGCAHVSLSDLDVNNWLTFPQAGLKILQTGMYSVMLCAVVLRTRSLLGAMAVHAIDDWLLFVVSTGLYGEVLETEYVTPDQDEAIATIIFYLIICALYLPTFIKAVIELRRMEAPQWGPFVREAGELPAAEMPNGQVPAGYAQVPYGQVPHQEVPYQQAPYQQAQYQQTAYQQEPYQGVPQQWPEPAQQAYLQQPVAYPQPPTYQQPTYQESTYQQPGYQQPAYQQPSQWPQPAYQEPQYPQQAPGQQGDGRPPRPEGL